MFVFRVRVNVLYGIVLGVLAGLRSDVHRGRQSCLPHRVSERGACRATRSSRSALTLSPFEMFGARSNP